MPLLYYWRPDNYRRDLDFGVGYHLNQPNPLLHEIELGESLWAFSRARNGRYVLAAELVIRAKTINPPGFRYGPYRVWGDLEKSRYFQVDDQPSIEQVVRQLSVTTGARYLGQSFQGYNAVKRLTLQDHQILSEVARDLPLESRARILPEERLEAAVLMGDPQTVYDLITEEQPGVAEERQAYLYQEAPMRNRRLTAELQELYNGRCQITGWAPRDRYGHNLCHAHHIHWLSRGGEDTLENLMLISPNLHAAVHRCDAPFDSENVIRLDPALCDLFNGYWELVMPTGWISNIAMPFYYLQSEGFWHLIPVAGSAEKISRITKPSVAKLHRIVRGARLNEALFLLLTMEKPREVLRATLIQAHFTTEIHDALTLQGTVNAEAFLYSQALLEQARRDEQLKEPSAPPAPVRDQGFRRAVVTAYNHRCALCGISIRTPDNHTAVDAAHIIDWSVSHNDDPRNGMALCKLCHWTFDAGLMSVSGEYTVILSRELSATYNAPGHLSTLEHRGIIGPEQRYLWPDHEALAWHRKHKLL